MMDDDLPPPTPGKLADAAITLFLFLAFGAPCVAILAGVIGLALGQLSEPASFAAAGIVGLIALVIVCRWLYFRVRGGARDRAVVIIAWTALVVLPVWGLVYNHFVAEPACEVGSCRTHVFRPFAEPEVLGLLALHALTVLAYGVSRRRPEALRPVTEALVHATLLAGVLVHGVMAIHIAPWTAKALVVPTALLPALAPITTVVLYVAELRARLRRRGREAAVIHEPTPAPTAYRHAPSPVIPPPPGAHRASLVRALALGPAVLGVYAVVQALILGRSDGALQVFTRTCDQVLSLREVVILPESCHYLCTVAARGHTWLVRPERLGRRGGIPILVNRQLAVANAFEDLLHERWPRFGRLARRLYDRVGLPLSRHIQNPWLADLTYLAMKPAEHLFALALLLLDRTTPERRIARMYR